MNATITKINKSIYDKGTMYRNPSNNCVVEFSDGEKVTVSTGDGEPFACGLIFQKGEQKEEYGSLAIEAVENLSNG